jgi:hypothetical protein
MTLFCPAVTPYSELRIMSVAKSNVEMAKIL